MRRDAYGGDEGEVDGLAEGLNLPGRHWPMKALPIDYEQVCTDRLNPPLTTDS
jgi:hypothetical protein